MALRRGPPANRRNAERSALTRLRLSAEILGGGGKPFHRVFLVVKQFIYKRFKLAANPRFPHRHATRLHPAPY
jgi:hypothetical protein